LLLLAAPLFASEAKPARVAVAGEKTLVERVQRLGYAVYHLQAAEVTENQLHEFDVLFVGTGVAGSLADKQQIIESYVRGGGGLIVEQPNETGRIQLLPDTAATTVDDWMYDGDNTRHDPVRDAVVTAEGQQHPITAGLAADDFPAVADKICRTGLSSAYTVLAVQITNADLVQIAVARCGDGRVVVETGNTQLGAMHPGSDRFLRRMIDWAAHGEASP